MANNKKVSPEAIDVVVIAFQDSIREIELPILSSARNIGFSFKITHQWKYLCVVAFSEMLNSFDAALESICRCNQGILWI